MRTIPVPDWVKAGIDAWMEASGIAEGILLRSINKARRVWGAGFSPKVIWGVVKEKAKICDISALAPHDSVRPVPAFAIRQVASLNRYSCWVMSQCKQPRDTSDANSASTTPSMIGSESSRTRRDLRRFRITSRLKGRNPPSVQCALLKRWSIEGCQPHAPGSPRAGYYCWRSGGGRIEPETEVADGTNGPIMVWNDRKRLLPAVVAIVACLSAAVGMAVGVSLGRALLLRSASERLAEYASELSSYALLYGAEVGSIWEAYRDAAASDTKFCSTEEIASMRSAVFRSLQIKDIGRTRNGSLRCSAMGGRFSSSRRASSEYMILANGAQFYPSLSLSDPAISGPVLEKNGVAVQVSPHAFDYWARPRLHFAVLIVNPANNQVLKLAGENLEATASCALTESETRSTSTLYRVYFRDANKTCIVASEAISDVWAGEARAIQGYGALGGLLGLSLGVASCFAICRQTGLVQQLRKAIRKGELFVVYQPLIDLPSRKIAGVEALVRWTQPGRGPIPPDLFVRIAEEYGLIGELTGLVLRIATGEMADLMRKYPNFTLSVNVAAADLKNDQFYCDLEKRTSETGIRPEQLALELTERSTADLATIRSAIERLHRLNYKIHIDDFGTGFSNISYLNELAADVIKIDRVFVQGIETGAVTATILPQMLAMTEAVGIPVVVEGVETECQLHFLESTERPLTVQGFYFGRPEFAATIIERVIAQNRTPETRGTQVVPFRSTPREAGRLA